MTLETILSELHFIREIEDAILWKIHQERPFIDQIAERAYCGEHFDFALCRHRPLTRLAVVAALLPRQYDACKAAGIPDGILLDTFRDVSLRANRYYERTGQAGISREDVIWFRHIMNASIFKIGALQFQPFAMQYLDEETLGEPYMTFTEAQKQALPAGTPVLNCHIPHGADLSPQSVDASFQNARSFFSAYFPTVPYRAFLCYSWLLYPPMQKLLSQESNIKRLASRFSVIGFCPDPEQAIENLFGQGAEIRLPDRPTSLQTLAAEHPERFGFACGILLL